MMLWDGSRLFVVVGALFATTNLFAQTVLLELKTGDRINGQIISETTNRLVLSNAWAKEMVIPLTEVLKRTPVPALGNASNAPLALTNVAAAKGTNAAAKTNVVALAKAVAATNSFFTSPLLKNWHGDLLVGTDLTFSERNRQVYNAKAKLTYAKDRFKSVFDYDATYGRSEVDETVNGVTRRVMKTDANRMNGAAKMRSEEHTSE